MWYSSREMSTREAKDSEWRRHLVRQTSLGFQHYAEALKIYLAKYRELQAKTPVGIPVDPKLKMLASVPQEDRV